MQKSEYEDMAQKLEESGDYRVIRRFVPVEVYNENPGQELKKAIFLDVETTGMDADEDQVIELAMVPFEFDKDGNIYRVLPAYNGFNDPGLPIPELITRITGITDDMVRGKKLDLDAVSAMLKDAVIVIAHNARFDRPFVENLLDDFKDIAWGCSIADVDWNRQGFEGVKLEYLAYKFGFFYEGHRATIDCQAGIEILSRHFEEDGKTVLNHLLKNARRTDIRLWAEGAPFDRKDVLKKRGYRWSAGDDGKRKAWYKDLSEDELEEEMRYLNESIYPRAVGVLPTDKFNARIRYSKRI